MELNPYKKISKLNQLVEGLTNSVSTLSRRFSRSLFGVSHDGLRDINTVYGYNIDPDFADFYNAFRFQDIAAAVIKKPARSCWRETPALKVGEDKIFEDELIVLDKLRIFDMLERADILNRIGRFSVLFVGVPDGLDPKDPLGRSNERSLENLYFTPYAEDGITISKWENDPLSNRFGLPLQYTLQIMDRGDKRTTVQTLSRNVHWTRIVHLAEGALDSDVEGLSALSEVLNRLVDLNKTMGGSSEAYFRNARGKYAFKTDPEFKSTISPEDKAALIEEVNAFTNNWQDIIRLSGIDAKVLNTPHASPEWTVKVSMQAIAGATGIPIRILTGEGAGQLAGNEDKLSYNQLITDRQNQLCSGWLLRTLQILAEANMIKPVPANAVVDWPVTEALNEKEKSEIRQNNADALNKASAALSPLGGLDGEVQAKQVIEEILQMEYDPLLEDGIPPVFDDPDDPDLKPGSNPKPGVSDDGE